MRSDRGVWGFARLGLPVLLLFACGEPPRAAGFRILADAWVDAEARTGRITVHVEIKLPYAGAGEYTLKAEVAGPAGRASGSATGALKTKGGRAAGSIEGGRRANPSSTARQSACWIFAAWRWTVKSFHSDSACWSGAAMSFTVITSACFCAAFRAST